MTNVLKALAGNRMESPSRIDFLQESFFVITYDGWEPQPDEKEPSKPKQLGCGGQGIVYLARSPERVQQMQHSEESLLRALSAVMTQREINVLQIAHKIVQIGGADDANHLGALKLFKIPSADVDEEKKAIGRLQSEVQALETLRGHPAVLKLLHANVPEHFIVTEYHSGGTLDKQLKLYEGDALAALEAFKPLVDGVLKSMNKA